MESTYFRRGFGLKAEIEGQLAADYHSAVVETLRANQYRLTVGSLTFRLAREFGFCYGVDRAVDYAYETRIKFPDRRLYLVGRDHPQSPCEPRRLRTWASNFSPVCAEGEFDFSGITTDDVVILPAFGVTIGDFERLRGDRLRAGGHHLRLGAQRLEAGGELRPRRLHRDHPRQAMARGDQSDREP